MEYLNTQVCSLAGFPSAAQSHVKPDVFAHGQAFPILHRVLRKIQSFLLSCREEGEERLPQPRTKIACAESGLLCCEQPDNPSGAILLSMARRLCDAPAPKSLC